MTKKGVPSLTHVDIYSKVKGVHFTSLETDRGILGWVWESRSISDNERCTLGSYSSSEGTVNSPDLKKPKNPMQQAAQIMTESGERGK